MSSFLQKLQMLREYLFDQIRMISADVQEVKQKDQQVILIKLINIYVKSIKNFKNQFHDEIIKNGSENIELKFTDHDICDILGYKNAQVKVFKDDPELCKQIYRSAQKLIITFMLPPEPFKNETKNLEEATHLIIKNQV